jgi:nucleoside-triphosphatase
MKIFLVGRPGIGKTTIIKKWISEILNQAGGFYTEEIRIKDRRVGFKIKTIDGKEGILAEIGRGEYNVGKYKVNLEIFEKIGVKTIEEKLKDERIEYIVIDEIGKMELFSEKFKNIVRKIITSDKNVIGVITMAKNVFVEELKKYDIKIIEVNEGNRDRLLNKKLKEIENEISRTQY